jgi:hypothetical protein
MQFGVRTGWNIVSVPLAVGDFTKTVLFPTAATPAYAYDDGYFGYVTLENGRAYWMKYSGNETVAHDGLERTEDTIAVQIGWNMVGGLSSAVPISNVSSIPGGIVTSSFYKYEGAYVPSATMEPGVGYWVKVTQAGQLVISTAAAVPENRIRIELIAELPPPPPDDILTEQTPAAYALEQNYPNPFNPATEIRYAIPVGGHVRLSVFNLLGQEIAVLVDEVREAGYASVSFSSGTLPSGVYYYTISAGEFTDTKRMLLVR